MFTSFDYLMDLSREQLVLSGDHREIAAQHGDPFSLPQFFNKHSGGKTEYQ